MIPQTVGRKYYAGKVATIQCVKNDSLSDISIKDKCFLLLIVHEGTAYFSVGDKSFEAIAPCLVCFDEREDPILVKKNGLKCDAIYFHPQFLNLNMTFEQVHSERYDQLALVHDMLLMKPFISKRKFVFPLFEEHMENLNRLFSSLQNELNEQPDWYWPCRARSFFIEVVLMLERIYRLIENDDLGTKVSSIKNPHLRNAVIYIESHYYENIILENISQAASLNHSTLTKLFKEELNVTPIEYLWRYRTTVAKKQLAFTNLPIKDISERCGYKTLAHFSRKFESYTGCTPTDYRKKRINEQKAAFG